jgi:hypothetical protein
MTRRDPEPCGTYGGLQRHHREGTEVCAACRIAAAVYMVQYRASHPEKRAAAYQQQKARYRALARLAEAHPTEFSGYLEQERGKLDEQRTDD